MASVRCPSCDAAQPIEAGATAYTCSSCGKHWSFVVCRSCGSRFHSKPRSTTWTCPNCGLLQDASSGPPPQLEPKAPAAPARAASAPIRITDAELDKPQERVASAFPPGLGLGDDGEGPHDAFAMPVRESTGRPWWIYAAIAASVLIALAVVLTLVLGGDDGDPAPPGVTAEEATATMCGHVRQIQVFREGALAGAAELLGTDAAALKQAGERRTAKQVRTLITSIEDARRALANQRDTAEPFAALRRAIDDLPCGP